MSLDFLKNYKEVLNELGKEHYLCRCSGVGKTHLAISIGIKAVSQMKRVLFYTAEKLTEELASAEVSGQLNKKLDILSRIDLLIIDELGYLSLSKPFEQWGEIFNDDIVSAAILDRLLHHRYTFLINGKSFRLKNITRNVKF